MAVIFVTITSLNGGTHPTSPVTEVAYVSWEAVAVTTQGLLFPVIVGGAKRYSAHYVLSATSTADSIRAAIASEAASAFGESLSSVRFVADSIGLT